MRTGTPGYLEPGLAGYWRDVMAFPTLTTVWSLISYEVYCSAFNHRSPLGILRANHYDECFDLVSDGWIDLTHDGSIYRGAPTRGAPFQDGFRIWNGIP